jgi:hypothetical protein
MYNLHYVPTTFGYKVEEKLYLGVHEQKRLNTTALEVLLSRTAIQVTSYRRAYVWGGKPSEKTDLFAANSDGSFDRKTDPPINLLSRDFLLGGLSYTRHTSRNV